MIRLWWHRLLGHNAVRCPDGFYRIFCDKDWSPIRVAGAAPEDPA